MNDVSERTYKNFKVAYLSEVKSTPDAVRDKVNPDLWMCEDTLPGISADAVIQQVVRRGDTPIRVKPVTGRSSHIPADYRTKFLLAILFSVQAGTSAGRALEQTIESETWPLRGQLDPALRLSRAGASFSDALAILNVYDETTLAILGAGEQTGTMTQALSTALEHLQRKTTADTLLQGAIAMILLDIFIALSSSLSSVFGLLPQAEAQGLASKDPASLAAWTSAINLSYAFNWVLIAIAVFVLIFAMYIWYGYEFGTADAKLRAERHLKRLPFLGTALLHQAVAVTSSIAGHLLKGGVLFLHAAGITVRTTKHEFVRNYWSTVIQLIESGVPVGHALSRPPLTVAEQRVVASHTSSAQLSEAFSLISESRATSAATANKRFIIMGLVTSFVYSMLGIAATLYVNYIQFTALMASTT